MRCAPPLKIYGRQATAYADEVLTISASSFLPLAPANSVLASSRSCQYMNEWMRRAGTLRYARAHTRPVPPHRVFDLVKVEQLEVRQQVDHVGAVVRQVGDWVLQQAHALERRHGRQGHQVALRPPPG